MNGRVRWSLLHVSLRNPAVLRARWHAGTKKVAGIWRRVHGKADSTGDNVYQEVRSMGPESEGAV